MANITESASFTPGIYQFEVTDAIQGGAGGVDNLPHQQLANRTQYLLAAINNILSGSSALSVLNVTGNGSIGGALSVGGTLSAGNVNLTGAVYNSASVGEKYRLINDGSFISFFANDNATRRGYLQGNAGNMTLASDSGDLLLNCPGVITLGGQLRTNPNTIAVGGTTQTQTRIFANAGNPAVMTFERSGQYAVNMGLDTDNVFRLGGYSDGANIYRLTLDASGNLVTRGGITLSSGNLFISGTNSSVEIGSLSAAGASAVDFHTSGNSTDYDARLIASGGTTTAGAGLLKFIGSAFQIDAPAYFFNGNGEKIRVANDGSFFGFYAGDNSTRRGYLQSNATNITLASDSGNLILGSALGTKISGFLITSPNTIAVGSTTQAQTRIFANAGNPAVMTFERSGQYAVNMGLDTDNVFRLGGYNDGANVYRLTVDPAGSASLPGSLAVGPVTASPTNVSVNPISQRVNGATVSAAGLLAVRGAAGATAIFGLNANSGQVVGFYSDNGTPTIAGSIAVSGATTAYNTSSDRRIKTKIAAAPEAADLIDFVEVREFEFLSDPGHKHVGFIAQELFEVLPDAVTPGDDGEEVEQQWGVDMSKLVPLLVKTVQELRARVAALEAAAK